MSQSEREGLEETEWAGPGGRVESERGGEKRLGAGREGVGGARWGRAELELDGTHPLTRVNYAARRKGR